MFQPEVKLEFVRRYRRPDMGWDVYVDVDPSEIGRTGGQRTTDAARMRQIQMRESGEQVIAELRRLGATVGGNREEWRVRCSLPKLDGDRDIAAFHKAGSRYVVAEVEGESSGQPEQKLYKAIGQIVMAASLPAIFGFNRRLYLVVHGEGVARHLSRATALGDLGVSALSIARDEDDDRWLFGGPPEVGGQ